MSNYRDQSAKYEFAGMCPGRPPDRMPQGRCAYAQNLRFYEAGAPQPRPGTTVLNATALDQTFVHTIAQLNDSIPGAATPVELLVGAGTKLYRSAGVGGAITEIDSGYSGNRMSMVPWRPNATPSPWMYVYDSSRSRKAAIGGDVRNIGIVPPNSPPTIALGAVNNVIVDETISGAGWTTSGGASGLGASDRLSTSILEIAYDAGTTGWASFVPGEIPLGPVGLILEVGGSSETVMVEDAINLAYSTAAVTIADIAYDSGTSGPCTVQPSSAIVGLVAGAILTDGSIVMRVSSVSNGPNGVQTFRTSTATTASPGDSLLGLFALRAYFANNHAPTNSLRSSLFTFTNNGTGAITKAVNLNLGKIGGRATQPSDLFRIGFGSSSMAAVTSVSLQLDVSDGTFSSQYFEYNFSPVQLYPSLDGQITQLEFAIADLVAVGSTELATLSNVVAIRVQVVTTSSVTITVSGWWLGGTYGPEVTSAEQPYEVVYTYLSSATGAESNASPISRIGLSPSNEQMVYGATQSSDPQVDTIRFYRRGGGLSTWNLAVSTPNSATPSAIDVFDDSYVGQQPVLDQDVFVPFPVIDLPRSGTCNVQGTAVSWVSGDTFNTSWAAGGAIEINGTIYELYGSPDSTTMLNIQETAGFQTGVAFTFQQPLITGQPLPAVWGPYQGVFMGCGDPYNPGYLYWTNGNDPDACGDDTNIEACSPSEPLVSGCMYNGRSYLLSSARMFIVTPNGNLPTGQPNFQVQDVPNSKGLLAPSLLTVGPEMFFVASDGIYASSGGAPRSLTDADLRPLFPKEGQPGVSITVGQDTVVAPDLSNLSNAEKSSLTYADQYLYFDYIGIDGQQHTLVLDLVMGGWSCDVFTFPVRPTCHYSPQQSGIASTIVGSNDGRLYLATGDQDSGSDFTCVLSTPSYDRGTARGSAFFADFGFRTFSSTGGSLTTLVYLDEYSGSATPSPVTVTAPAGYSYFTNDILAANIGVGGRVARNIAFRHSWAASTGNRVLDVTYGFVEQPDLTVARAVYISDLGSRSKKFIQGCRVEISTLNAAKTFTVYADGAQAATFSVTSATQTIIPVSFASPFNAYDVQLVGDGTPCYLFDVQWVFDVLPDAATTWETETFGYNLTSYMFMRYGRVRLQSAADVTMTVTTDGAPQPTVLTIQNTNGQILRRYVEFQPLKFQSCSFKFTSAQPFSLFVEDLEVYGKTMNGESLVRLRPFGGESNQTGARI